MQFEFQLFSYFTKIYYYFYIYIQSLKYKSIVKFRILIYFDNVYFMIFFFFVILDDYFQNDYYCVANAF